MFKATQRPNGAQIQLEMWSTKIW